MRTLLVATVLTVATAVIGCGGGSAMAPATPANLPGTDSDSLSALKAEVDSYQTGRGTLEIIDAETGAIVSSSDFYATDGDDYDVDLRSAQDVQFDPVVNSAFRVQLTIDTDPPFAPRGYTTAGNPLYYIGDIVNYDIQVRRRFPLRNRMARLGAFDMEITHLFAGDNSLLPECVAGQNPRAITGIDFVDLVPDGALPNGGDASWSGGNDRRFTVADMQFKLCNLPGMQFGTDLINVELEWVVTGAELGMPCGTCIIRTTIFDSAVGIYDPS